MLNFNTIIDNFFVYRQSINSIDNIIDDTSVVQNRYFNFLFYKFIRQFNAVFFTFCNELKSKDLLFFLEFFQEFQDEKNFFNDKNFKQEYLKIFYLARIFLLPVNNSFSNEDKQKILELRLEKLVNKIRKNFEKKIKMK